MPPNPIEKKFQLVTDTVVRVFGADFARIWMIKSGDRCNAGCVHAHVAEGHHICRFRDKCLHLLASSGRYTHTDGGVHARVPFGCYKIGKIAAGDESGFLTNEVTTDPRVHNHAWAKELGLVSFAGYRLIGEDGIPVGVLALFSKHAISKNQDSLLQGFAHIATQALLSARLEDELVRSEERYRTIANFTYGMEYWRLPDGSMAYMSPSCERITGYKPQEFLQDPGLLDSIVHPDDRPAIEHPSEDSADITEGRAPCEIEFRIHTRSGEERWIGHVCQQVVGTDGKHLGRRASNRDITDRKRAQAELEHIHKQLVDASRRSGMAEIATNILHNVGNVLNSVNISAGLIVESVKNSKASNLARVVALLGEHAQDLGAFITTDSRGKHLPAHLAQLSEHLLAEQAAMGNELDSLRRSIDHIKAIVTLQQRNAKFGGVKEMTNVVQLVEDSLRLNEGGLNRHGVALVREFETVPSLNVEKHKILQILVNLLRNAKHACQDAGRPDRRLTVRVANGPGRVEISVRDNGVGILPENLTRIFNHGFTTRKDGHGFGLHSGSLAAKEMGGALTVQSDGPGHGAVFTLELPCPTREDAHE